MQGIMATRIDFVPSSADVYCAKAQRQQQHGFVCAKAQRQQQT